MNIFNVHILARWTVKVTYLTEACNTRFISYGYPAFQLFQNSFYTHQRTTIHTYPLPSPHPGPAVPVSQSPAKTKLISTRKIGGIKTEIGNHFLYFRLESQIYD